MALELKKGPGRSCSKLAGLITVRPLMGEQLGGLYRVPTWKGNVTVSTWKRSPISLLPYHQGGAPHSLCSPPSVDIQLLWLGERVRSSAPGPW